MIKNKIIIGRTAEKEILKELADSNRPEFIAITGRRRVGKTYLIKTYFQNKIDFEFSGILNATQEQQLDNFYHVLKKHFPQKKKWIIPTNWFDAFRILCNCLEVLIKKNKKRKLYIFIDELPWLDTHKSDFIIALGWFWNSWAENHNVIFIVCGSSTSWVINNIINNKGGLHNRITKRIHLHPFTLYETELFLKHQGIQLSRYHVLQLYMVFGGVPHYLKEVVKGESPMQAINRICFKKNGLLVNEFDNLYKALFKNSDNHVRVVHALATKLKGLTRAEILKITKLNDGGTVTKVLAELEWCNFIMTQQPYGKIKKEMLYRLSDEFSLFYIRFMHKKKSVNWLQLSATPTWKTWSGYSFESICIKHIEQIKKQLGFSNVYTEHSGFVTKGNQDRGGAQIDLILDRKDKVINICEVNFFDKPYVITKQYADNLRNKVNTFRSFTNTNKTIFVTFISVYGLIKNAQSLDIIQQEATLDSLFLDIE